MPTPPLPVLHALLGALGIPIQPPTLQSISPTLLLLALETIQGSRLPIGSLRSPESAENELELTKLLLGVLTDDLALDLSLVDPQRVVNGDEPDIAVVIMALAVAARRAGVEVRLPTEEPVGENTADEDTADGQASGALNDNSRVLSDTYGAYNPTELVTPPRGARDAGVPDTSLELSEAQSERHDLPGPHASPPRKTLLHTLLDDFGLGID